MYELVRQQIGVKLAEPGFHEGLFIYAVVARFVMLKPEMRHVIAQREQKMIVAIMVCAEKLVRFLHRGCGSA